MIYQYHPIYIGALQKKRSAYRRFAEEKKALIGAFAEKRL